LAASPRSARAKALRAASNVLLGLALGLLSYYGLTTLVSAQAQQTLVSASASVEVFVAPQPEALVPVEVAEEPSWDFSGWEAEDWVYWESLAPGEVFARIVIPAMEVDTLVIKGVGTADLRKGPGWIDWSDLPGPTGTCGISGHRTTYGAPFRRLGELAPGDIVELYSPYRRYRYEVAETLVVWPYQVEVVASTVEPSLTLTACHPPYSARQRLAVRAMLVDVARIDGATIDGG